MIAAGTLPRTAVRAIKARLEAAGCEDAAFDAACLVELVTGREPRFDEEPLGPAQADRLEKLTQKREKRYPLQYLSGKWDFLDVTLSVGEGVLCPRADTEVVCEAAAEKVASLRCPKVLDLCAGSGCLGIGVRRLVPQAEVTCLEKSPEALRYLRRNCAEQGVAALEGDLFGFERTLAPASLDLIVSNPPYLTAAEMAALQPEVRFEPTMALEAGEDGLEFYRYLAAHYGKALRPGGWMVVEIGWQQAAAVVELFSASEWQNVACQKDYNDRDRVVLAQKI